MREITYIMIGVAFALTSCVEEIETNASFSKVIGKQGSSLGNKMLELPNGDIMIAGKLGVPAHDINWTGNDIFLGRVQDLAPALMITDKNGTVKKMRSYPIPRIDIRYDFVSVSDYEGKASFTDVVQMADGSFFALGEFKDFLFEVPREGIIQNTQTRFPFLMKLTPELDVEYFKSFNGSPVDPDSVIHLIAYMKKLPGDSLLVALGLDVYSPYIDDDPRYSTPPVKQGFTLLKLAPNGDSVVERRYTNAGYQFIRDMQIVGGDVVLIGRKNTDIACFRTPLSSLNNDNYAEMMETVFVRSSDRFNVNEFYIFPLKDGRFATVCTDPRDNVLTGMLGSDLKGIPGHNLRDITGVSSSEYPRAAYRTQNEDLLIYTEKIDPGRSDTYGFLYRVTPDGTVSFRLELEGIPGDVIEYSDGNILVLSNVTFNGLLLKATLTKLSSNGKFY